jgi:hypothetical protein
MKPASVEKETNAIILKTAVEGEAGERRERFTARFGRDDGVV